MTAAMSGPLAPPDSTGAIGPNNYVEMDNSNIAVYDRSLNLLNRTSLTGFVGVSPSVPYSDVQVQWDPTANRWLFAFLFANLTSPLQYVVIGWSLTASPLPLSGAGWCQIGIRTDPYLMDFPKLGHNSKYLVIGGNFYDESHPSVNPPFKSAVIAWVPLPANGSTTCPASVVVGHTTQSPLKNGDGVTNTFTPVPVNTDTGSANGYVISAYDPSGSNGQSAAARNKLAIWHLDAAGVLHRDAELTVTTYDTPAAAPQAGTTHLIDTLDGRLTQAVGDPTTGIYTQHTVNGPAGRSEVDWYEIIASGSATTLAQQGAISDPSLYVFNAAISPRFDAQGAAIFYDTSSPLTRPAIVGQIRRPTTAAGAFEPGSITLASSPAADTDFTCTPCRWGDYSGASPDPVQTNVVWGTSEFNTASGATPAWSDENFAVYVALKPQAPSPITAACCATNGSTNAVNVGWSPAAFDPGAPATGWTVTEYVGANPGTQIVVGGSTFTAQFVGLTKGTTYTFTVIATNVVGDSPESAHSNPVTVGAAAQSTGGAPPARAPVQQVTSPPPTPGPR